MVSIIDLQPQGLQIFVFEVEEVAIGDSLSWIHVLTGTDHKIVVKIVVKIVAGLKLIKCIVYSVSACPTGRMS